MDDGLDTLREQGIQNISDGLYIKSKIIPLAYSDEHWHIVVAQTHMSVELILKGLIRVTGQETRKSGKDRHDLKPLLTEFTRRLETDSDAIPQLHLWLHKNSNFYGLELFYDKSNNTLYEYVFKYVAGIYTMLSTSGVDISVARNANYILQKNGWELKLYRNGNLITHHTDASILSIQNTNYVGASFLPIDSETIRKLRKPLATFEKLDHKSANYAEISINKEHARKRIDDLDQLVEALKPFINLIEQD